MEALSNWFFLEPMRLDKWLVQNNFVTSRAKAKDLILQSAVKINGAICLEVNFLVSEKDLVEVQQDAVDAYVSRSAHKLKMAMDFFQVIARDKIALDVGMSTGGFTQVLLEQGVKKVIGVDVGHDQLHQSLKNNERVVCHEGINVKDGLPFDDQFELIVVDVSFISIEKIINVLKSALAPKGILLILIKPQFEQSSQKRKMILSDTDGLQIAQKCRDVIIKNKLSCSELFKVPLKGKEGNQEYFIQCEHFSTSL